MPDEQEETVEEQVEAEQETAETDEPAAAEQAQADADPTDEPPTDESAEDGEPAQLSDTEAKILGRLGRELGDDIVESASAHGTLVVRVKRDAWRRVAEVSKDKLQCDYLSFISGIDWQPAPREGGEVGGASSAPVQPTEMTFGVAGSDGRFQLLALVESTEHKWGVAFKTDLDEAAPKAESWVTVYPGADWHERETWEMFGVGFDGHPSLRHIYLPSEFEGHPLRKDFPLLARHVKPWPGLVDVEPMPGEEEKEEAESTEGQQAEAEGQEAEGQQEGGEGS
jgi:NADH-quinone oxidoreductase subunit C